VNTQKTFDWHLGAVVEGLALPHGGRQFLIDLLPWSRNTVIRRLKGEAEFTVKELELVAHKINATPGEIIAQALRNYSGGTAEDGIRMLMEEETAKMAVSAPPASLDAKRKQKSSTEHMTDDQLEAERSAASTDPEHLEDEHHD